jgi:hypothetical protein
VLVVFALIHQKVDNFLADTSHFSTDFLSSPEAIPFQKAIQQLLLGIRDGRSGCNSKAPLIVASSYSALAVIINWLHKHPIALSWLQQPLLQSFNSLPKGTTRFDYNLKINNGVLTELKIRMCV